MKSRPLAALVLVSSLLLGGCAASAEPTDDAGASDAPAVEPAAGETITGDGYSYVVPEGWEDASGNPGAGAGIDSIAADLTDTDGFADNVNVVKSPAGEVTADVVETIGVDELEGAGAAEVTVHDRLQIAGSESAHVSAVMSSGGSEYLIDQYYVTQNGQTYIVTFSFSDTVSAADRDEIAASVLATWAWA